MNDDLPRRRLPWPILAITAAIYSIASVNLAQAEPPGDWRELFDGRSLDGWRASEHADTWRVEDGALVAQGPRSHLFYEGPVGHHDFRNFELQAQVRTQKGCNSGIFLHTQYQPSGCPNQGCSTVWESGRTS